MEAWWHSSPVTTVVWSAATKLHVPKGEVWVGMPDPGDEVPERVDLILAALRDRGHAVQEAAAHDDTVLEAVHDPAFLHHLRTVHEAWMQSGIPERIGQDRVVPYMFATAAMLDGLPGRVPAAVHARAGRFAFDTMTPVGPHTWEAARAAVDCALTAADVVRGGQRSAYALCRPPGHHVTRSAYGGSCYLNNAAVAAEALRRGGFERVAIVDVDAHHGNGTASIFYERADVFYGSVHIDPGAGWFPHVVGFADETGSGAGAGTTMNVPLPPETGDAGWLEGVARLVDAVRAHRSTALVISLGVDAAADDPNSPLRVTKEGYGRAGALLEALHLPTVLVQEGGYHLPTLGGLVAAALEPFRA
jgi:acetoin utilization deacetylase AcuC-like enzyme